MLEEIDESEYKFGIPGVGDDGDAVVETLKTTKRKRGDSVDNDVIGLIDGKEEENATVLKKKSKKKPQKKKKKKSVTDEAEKNQKTVPRQG